MKVLIVEDDALLRNAMSRALSDWGAEVRTAGTEQDGISALEERPDLLITDICLPKGGSGVNVVQAATRLKPTPLMLAVSGKASPMETFKLAQAGVAAYIPKPLDFIQFVAIIEAIMNNPPDFTQHISSHVGHESYHNILRRVRQTLLEQALARSQNNRVHASKLLEISRQAVQQLIRDFNIHTHS